MRSLRFLALSALALPVVAAAQAPTRAIRRDIPLTNMIRSAFAAGTRDSTGRPGPRYWQTQTNYTINARLDAPTSRVTGRETVVIHNNSDSAMRSIQLRLDQNIYAANVPRAEQVPEITDGMVVTRMAVNGQTVDLNPPPRARRGPGAAAAPVTLAAIGITQTTARITLPTPIAAHGIATLEADWNFKVPLSDNGRGLRMGAWGDSLYQVAQWYPRVAVYDDLRGWDTDPYLGPSEFYNNFGRFDVTLDVPAGWLVGASGVLQNPNDVLTPAARERLSHALESDETRSVVSVAERGPGKSTVAGDRLTWHFVAEGVADFAWATSDRFVWDVTRATIPGGNVIPVNVFYEPGHAAGYAPVGQLSRHALEFYSRLWMPYAFPQLTVVDGPDGGMEYPMFIMSGAGAADHETGHQWWPMMVGTNETWYGFMDEGFNQYMNILSGADRNHLPANLDGLGQSYGRTSGDEREAPLMWDANYGGPNYSFQAYGKSPLMLSMLGGIVSDTAVWRAQSEYAKAWRFKHPSPWDYAFFMSNALHRDLGWFWYYWLFTTESVDGSISGVESARGKTTVTVRQDGQMPSPVVLKVQFAPTGAKLGAMPNAVMTDSVTAIVTYPVDVWFGGSRTFKAALDFGARKIEKITLDPACRFSDRDVTDNKWPREAAVPAPPATPFSRGPRCG
ncbi:MAG TPA: M1 family metallopeptidase [Gemmatimonadaceae bacterium]